MSDILIGQKYGDENETYQATDDDDEDQEN